MNVLFLTTGRFGSIEDHAIYPDLLRAFRDAGHAVYSVSTYERRTGKRTECREEHGTTALRVRVGNLTGCGVIEKGISTLRIEGQYKRAIKKHLGGVKFDLVLYSTPPITLVKTVKYIKRRDGARSYLLLKDIFPQNAVDLGMMKKGGVTGLMYRYFRGKEKRLYAISDRIGCMSEANVRYLLEHNPEIPAERAEVCPNSVDYRDMRLDGRERAELRARYGIPSDKVVFVYGGNLGKPQGIPHLVECFRAVQGITDAHFLVVGGGTEYKRLEALVAQGGAGSVTLIPRLPKEDYDRMVAACDVGLISLDARFTIPNFPSRLLAYMQAGLPVITVTDPNTDVGAVAEGAGFGAACTGGTTEEFCDAVRRLLAADRRAMGERAVEYLLENYTAERGYKIIEKSV